mmetsp:Transcript_73883/g.196343  ORF Transcript_73883/g.196343 Transcript_73883/m.196343 type:complete len:239 (+) Transcript_73883:18-734(+)
MPSAIMPFMHVSHSTQLVSCVPSMSTISGTGVPGGIFLPVTFMYTSHLGGLILGSASMRAFSNLALAGFMNSVWKAPEVFRTFACKQPGSLSAFCCSRSTAGLLPAQEKPRGKRKFATVQMSVPLVFDSWQSLLRVSRSSPAMETIICGEACAASCMASPRNLTSFSPVSKSKTPAAHKAVYSPKDRPATALFRKTTSGLFRFSSSRAARPAMNIAGWQTLVCSSSSSGPLRQTLRTS